MPLDLALVIIAVEQLPRSLAFYRELLGWTQPIETPVYCELRSQNGMRLGLYDRERFGATIGHMPERLQGSVRSTELYFYTEDLDASVERACAAGATLLSVPAVRPWGDRVAYVADPDGTVLALAFAAISPNEHEDAQA